MTVDECTVQKIKDELVDAAGEAVRAGKGYAPAPEKLYHFTDCQGLIGILTDRSFWASLATGLNDDSEVLYALSRAERLLQDKSDLPIDAGFLSKVAVCLDPKKTFTGKPVEFDAYIISFCARVDRSVHWLHYGKSGTGCAVGLCTKSLIRKPFELVPVIYDEADQDRFISSIVEKVWSVVRRYNIEAQDSPAKKVLYEVAAESAAGHIRMAAPALKSPAFANEEEWRLITYDVLVDGREPKDSVPLAIKFRAAGGRVVPYFEYSLDEVPITDVVLGASFPMAVEDPALTILLRQTAGARAVDVIRSSVPVRP